MAARRGRSPVFWKTNVFRSDPVTNSDETGNFFYLSLQSDQAQSFFCDDVWRSINGGQSWTSRAEPAHGGDKEWFTIDKTNSTGHGFQYQFWTGFFACDTGAFTRSIDGGVTWMNPINIPNSAIRGRSTWIPTATCLSADWREPVFVHSLVQCKERRRHANF